MVEAVKGSTKKSVQQPPQARRRRRKVTKLFSAGIIVFRRTDEGPKFLLLYKGHGYWNFPKGTTEEGESSFRTALREVREETGLTRGSLALIEGFHTRERYTFRWHGEIFAQTATFYAAETKKEEVGISKEHEGYVWVLCRDAKKLLRHDTSRRILGRVMRLIEKGEEKKK